MAEVAIKFSAYSKAVYFYERKLARRPDDAATLDGMFRLYKDHLNLPYIANIFKKREAQLSENKKYKDKLQLW